jgi:hypothetical protein
MRLVTLAALSALTAAAAAPALAQDAAAPAATPAPAAQAAPQAAALQGAPTDQELSQFAGAMQRLSVIQQQISGGQPTTEQQAEMASIVENSGLEVERFNAISAQVSSDTTLQARAAVAGATPSPTGSVGASVTDAEAAQFATAMASISDLAQQLNGAQPNAEQQAQMASAIEASGLDIERFNAISGAQAQDEHLRARIALAAAQRGE